MRYIPARKENYKKYKELPALPSIIRGRFEQVAPFRGSKLKYTSQSARQFEACTLAILLGFFNNIAVLTSEKRLYCREHRTLWLRQRR